MLSDHFIRPEWNDWIAYLSTYTATCSHSASALTAHDWSLRQDQADLLLQLERCVVMGFGEVALEGWLEGGGTFFLLDSIKI